MEEDDKRPPHQIERQMPLDARQMIVGGRVDVRDGEWSPNYHSTFNNAFEEMFKNLQLPIVPYELVETDIAETSMSQVDKDEATGNPVSYHSSKTERHFKILPEFIAERDPIEWKKFQDIFIERFEMFYKNELDDDFDKDNPDHQEEYNRLSLFDAHDDKDNLIYPEHVIPHLPYRVPNEDFTNTHLERLLHLPKKENKETDAYGWIETRQRQFFNDLGGISTKYCLPRFAVKFDEQENPYFRASAKELTLFHETLAERMQIEDEEEKIRAEYKEYCDIVARYYDADGLFKEGMDDDDDEEDEMDPQTVENAREKVDEMEGRVEYMTDCYTEQWLEKNAELSFPSEIKSYPHEILANFQYSLDADAGFLGKLADKDSPLIAKRKNSGHKKIVVGISDNKDQPSLAQDVTLGKKKLPGFIIN